VNNIHLSIDIDSLDPKYVPGTGTPVEDGLTPEQLYRLIDTVTQNHRVKSVDVVELNPLLDDQNKTTEKITTDIIEYLAKKLN
jgi:arginase